MAEMSAAKDHYAATMVAFGRNSGVAQAMFSFVVKVTANVTATLFKDGQPTSSLFRVLGVGSGDGQVDLRILTAVATALGSSKIHSTVVEPSAQFISSYRSRVSLLPKALEGKVSFEWHEMNLEKFMKSCPRIERFDLIHFVASLYYMDAEKALSNCYERLAVGGAIFCTLGPEKSFFPKLSRKLKGKVDLGSIHKFYTEVDLVSIAERNNWKYKELSKTSYETDISFCFDHSSAEGGLLLDFLTHCQDFRSTADEMFYKEVMNFLEEESTTDDNGKKLVKPEITAVVIYK